MLSPAAQSAPTPPVAGQTSKPRLPPGSVWASTPAAAQQSTAADKPKPGMKATALEKAIATAKEAGAPEDALDSMRRELAALKSEAANSRPLGARLDSVEAKLAKAEGRVQAAEANVEKAMCQLEEAREQRRLMEEALAQLQMEVPQQKSSLPEEWLRSTRVLLERLETGCFAATTAIPQEVVAAMSAVHQVINAVDPLPAATMDAPLEPAQENVQEPAVAETPEDAEPLDDQDDVMGTLDGVDESDDGALLAIARRLKRARRS